MASDNRNIRENTFGNLTQEYIEAAPQVRLRVDSLRGAEVEPYIQAYTYLAARRVSSENARFLNDFAHWTHLPAKDVRDALESVLGAHICCPLGGDFQLEEGNGPTRWVGTEWRETSLYAVSETPQSWRFPFLDWIRRLDLRFELGPTTLRAQVDLLVHQIDDPAIDGRTMDLQLADPPSGVAVVDRDPDVTVAKPPMTTRSPSGARAASTTARSPVPPPVDDELLGALRGVSKPGGSAVRRTWLLGVRVGSPGQPMQITDVYTDSPASRVGLQVADKILAVDRVRPRSHAGLVELLRIASERDGVAVLRILRDGVTYRARIPLSDR